MGKSFNINGAAKTHVALNCTSQEESHKNSHRAYGSPRITKDIQARGTKCSENRVARLMKVHGIIAKAAKKFKATTNSKHNLPVAENL
ncbi:MAG: IS3 family transposase, partial [Bacteroidetes bacterium]|nr:IS3 family transposase [Bacteroidota bacterium]